MSMAILAFLWLFPAKGCRYGGMWSNRLKTGFIELAGDAGRANLSGFALSHTNREDEKLSCITPRLRFTSKRAIAMDAGLSRMTIKFRGLLDMVDTAANVRSLSQAVNAFANASGFSHYAFLDLQGAGARYLGNFPAEWERLYFAQRFCQLDPVVTRARRGSGAFFWSARDWQTIPRMTIQSFAANAIKHGISHGLTISARAGFDRQLLLTFASAFDNFLRPKQHDLSDAVPALMGLYHRLEHLGGTSANSPGARLSSRELLCLTWAAKGKTAAETGTITGLSTRTVQHYLDSAREKLHAATVAHLVAISTDLGLI
jgi:LuxR family transcriptional regulator, activator of conjugal transfer of Ti plasmids